MSEDTTSVERSGPAELVQNKTGIGRRALRYLEGIRVEMRHVSWPTWQQVRSTTLTVLLFTSALTGFVKAVDAITEFFYKLIAGMN